jgi:hypothetical protein
MGYPHFSGDCVDFHDRVIDWGGRRTGHRAVGTLNDPEIVTLCGSTRFKDEINRVPRASDGVRMTPAEYERLMLAVVVAARRLVQRVEFSTSDLFKDLVRAVKELDA